MRSPAQGFAARLRELELPVEGAAEGETAETVGGETAAAGLAPTRNRLECWLDAAGAEFT